MTGGVGEGAAMTGIHGDIHVRFQIIMTSRDNISSYRTGSTVLKGVLCLY